MKSDATLIKEFLDGSYVSFNELYNRHHTKIKSVIYNKVKDQEAASDFAQETWIKIINSLKAGKYNEMSSFIGWTVIMAKNLVGDQFRKDKNIRSYSIDDCSDKNYTLYNIESASTNYVRNEDHKLMNDLVGKLAPVQQQVIKDNIYNDYSFKDIAEKYKISINTALGRKRYAINNLRRMYYIIQNSNI